MYSPLDFIEKVKSIDNAEYSRKMKDELLKVIRTADDGVYDTFFSGYAKELYNSHRDKLAELSVKYTAFALSFVNNYGFNSTVTISYDTISEWFKNNNEIGSFLFRRILCAMGLEEYCNNGDIWKQIIETLTTETFIIGFDVEVLSSSQWSLSMLLGAVQAFDKNSANSVITAWKALKEVPFDFGAVEKILWFCSFYEFDCFSSLLNNDLTNAVNQCRKEEYKVEKGVYAPPGDVYKTYDTYHRFHYGESVLNWIKSDVGPKKYGIPTNTSVNNIETDQPSDPGCIRADAKIFIYENAQKPIYEIRAGDRILNKNGTGICSEDILKFQGTFILYGINDDEPIFTTEHCIYTDRGWCSLNPGLINEMNPQFDVTELLIGDAVHRCKLDKDNKPVFYKEIVKRINTVEVENAEVYDFRISDGAPECYANGILTLLAFPEISIGYIKQRISLLNMEDKRLFVSAISENKELIEKVFGQITTLRLLELLQGEK